MNTRLTRTPSSASNRKTFTISLWFKIGKHPFTDGAGGDSRELIGQTSSSYFRCIIKSDGTMRIYDESGFNFNTNRKFRDKSAFYHLVIRVDTTQATANDRVRVYINGLDERTVGGYSTDTAPSQNQDFAWNTTSVHQIGGHSNGYDYFSGVMSHIHHCDGTSLAPTVFGSTDSTTGEWHINASPSFTPGTNGFTILKDGNTITDQSSNSNNWSLASGTLTKTEDNPSNVFATWNPIMPQSANYSHGNTSVNQTTDADYRPIYSTIATPTTGKFYAEFKAVSGFDNINKAVGFIDVDLPFDDNAHIEAYANGGSYGANGRVVQNTSGDTSFPTFTNGDIIGIALDLDNGKVYYHKNGTYINSGVPTSGSTGTGAFTVNTGKSYVFAAIVINQGGANLWSANFGNGYFGTTAVSSAGTNASGIGIFEYDVPANFTALSTKGLNL